MASIYASATRVSTRVLRENRFPPAIRRSIASAAVAPKKSGDIGDAFASLSGEEYTPLDSRFATIKAQLIAGHEEAVQDSWYRLLTSLREELPLIASKGSSIVPEIDFKDLDNPSQEFKDEHRKRGVAVVRNVLPEQEALNLKTELKEYINGNPQTKSFNNQVFEVYWSKAQIRARGHENVIRAQKFLMDFWHSKDPGALISNHPTLYADRLRMRMPGDNKFSLGPHVDGGSCERWEDPGYAKVYSKIFQGQWEDFDPFESSDRLGVKSDLYSGVGACSMFRMYQGWLSLSETGPFQGTLLVSPLLSRATAYFLLRPFFEPKRPAADPLSESYDDEFLSPSNWQLKSTQDSRLEGATPGHGQELRHVDHPHLDLPRSLVHVPSVRPGDYVAWHCDTIHSVDKIHKGTSDSSVLYIPACPLSIANAEYLARQRSSFLSGEPSPDFGGGIGESQHVGRADVADVHNSGIEGAKGLGFLNWDSTDSDLSAGQKELMDRSNKILGFTHG